MRCGYLSRLRKPYIIRHADISSRTISLTSIYIRTLCMQAAKDLACLCICADTPKPSPRVDGGGVGAL